MAKAKGASNRTYAEKGAICRSALTEGSGFDIYNSNKLWIDSQ